MDDYISRKATLLKLMQDGCSAKNVQSITELPTADVEPVRHGEWKPCFEDWRKQIEGNKCSMCGFEYYGTGASCFNFYPSCGAKMDGGVEDAAD